MGVCYKCVLWAKHHAWGFTYISLLNYNNLGCWFEDEELNFGAFSPSLYSCVEENRRQPKAHQPNLNEGTLERK